MFYLNYFTSFTYGNRMLFSSREIMKITLPASGGAIIHVVSGAQFHVTSRFPSKVIKEPPLDKSPEAGYQFNRYEKLVDL